MTSASNSGTIIWLPSWYPNRYAPFNGDFIQRQARAVAAFRPIHVLFICKGSADMKEPVAYDRHEAGMLTETIAYYRPVTTGVKPLDRLLSIAKLLRVGTLLIREAIRADGRPSCIHVHVALWAGVLAWRMRRLYGIPYLVTEHWTGYDASSDNNVFRRDKLFQLATKRVLNAASMVVPVSHHLGAQIKPAWSVAPQQVIPNVVDTRYFHQGQPATGVFYFVHVSLMNFQKNPEAILRAFASLDRDAKVMLRMVGPCDEGLRQLAAELGLTDRVEFLGEVSYEQVASSLSGCHCFVMFSRYENLPCAILEALCTGLPVIATRVGGIPEIINESNGLLVDHRNEEELAAAMLWMLRHRSKFDGSSIAAAACAAFTYQAVGQTIAALYEKQA